MLRRQIFPGTECRVLTAQANFGGKGHQMLSSQSQKAGKSIVYDSLRKMERVLAIFLNFGAGFFFSKSVNS